MKVELKMVFDLPDYQKNQLAYFHQDVFDNLINYAIIKHLQDSMTWMVEESKAEGESKISCGHLIESHTKWSDKIREAEKTVELKIIE